MADSELSRKGSLAEDIKKISVKIGVMVTLFGPIIAVQDGRFMHNARGVIEFAFLESPSIAIYDEEGNCIPRAYFLPEQGEVLEDSGKSPVPSEEVIFGPPVPVNLVHSPTVTSC